MSIKLMTEAWKLPLPHTQKLVLLALCDNANDQGECYPSISMLSEKCSMSERSIHYQIKSLEDCNIIQKLNRPGRSTIYKINPCTRCTPAPDAPLHEMQTTPAPDADPPLHHVHPTPAPDAPLHEMQTTPAPDADPPLHHVHPTPAPRAPITVNEPSLEPSHNRQRASVGKMFEDFWEIYPNKTGKAPAKKLYTALLRATDSPEKLHDQIMLGLRDYLVSDKVRRGYVCNPETWLTESRWEDDFEGQNKLADKRLNGENTKENDMSKEEQNAVRAANYANSRAKLEAAKAAGHKRNISFWETQITTEKRQWLDAYEAANGPVSLTEPKAVKAVVKPVAYAD